MTEEYLLSVMFMGLILIGLCLCFLKFSSSYLCLCIYSLHDWWHFLLSGYQGEATSAQLIGQAIAKNPAFITLRKIEAAREIAQTISKSSNKVYLNADELLLNLQEMKLDNSQWEQPVM